MQDGGAPSGAPFQQSRKVPESDAFDLIHCARLYAGASTSDKHCRFKDADGRGEANGSDAVL